MPTFSDVVSFLSGQRTSLPPLPIDLSLRHKTVVITGANMGIGFEAAKYLVGLNVSDLILGCRSVEKGEIAKTRILELAKPTGTDLTVHVLQVDLESYASIVAFCMERTVTVNVISTYLLAVMILPALQATAERRRNKTEATLSFVGSMTHIFGPESQIQAMTGKNVFEALSDPETADMKSRYPPSKLIEHLCFLELVPPANRAAPGMILNLVNPGWCTSELSRNRKVGLLERLNTYIFQRTGDEGGRTLVHAVAAGRDSKGKYLSECQVKEQGSFVRSDRAKETRQRIWKDLVAKLVDIESGSMDNFRLL